MNELKNVLLLLLFVFGQCKSQEGMYHNALALGNNKDIWPSLAKDMYTLFQRIVLLGFQFLLE